MKRANIKSMPHLLSSMLLTVTLLYADTPAHFQGSARIQLLNQLHNGSTPNGQEIDTTVESVDLTHMRPVMLNRWAIKIPYVTLASWRGWTWVTGMCDGEGNLWTLIERWGMIAINPYDRQVWENMRKVTAFETRWQLVTVTEHEVLIEEPVEQQK